MNPSHFFYKLFIVDAHERPVSYLGTAFPVTPDGGLLTCRHVIDIAVPAGCAIAIFDNERACFTVIADKPVTPKVENVDIAYLPNSMQRPKAEFLPILSPAQLKIGEDVYSFGYFSTSRHSDKAEQGYFSGKVVNFFDYELSERQSKLTLPFAVLEGMSGSPILTYHNGPKVVGIGIGNRSSRILASEVLHYQDEKQEYHETVNRIVEFGVAHHCAAVVGFLSDAGISGFVVSEARVPIPGLED